jgi:hypothetical protein
MSNQDPATYFANIFENKADWQRQVHPSQDAVYLLAYPRSGSSWLRYCLEFITKRRAGDSPLEQSTWDTMAEEPRLIYLTHDWNDHGYGIYQHLDDTSGMIKHILLVRNYKEAVMSQMINFMSEERFLQIYFGGFEEDRDYQVTRNLGMLPAAGGAPEFLQNLTPSSPLRDRVCAFEYLINTTYRFREMLRAELEQYYNLIAMHHVRNAGIMIRYEDLITDLESSLTKIINYLHNNRAGCFVPPIQEMEHNMQQLLKNYEHHRNICLSHYKSEPKTRGKPQYLAASALQGVTDLHRYSSMLSEKTLLLFDTMIEEIPPHRARPIKKDYGPSAAVYDFCDPEFRSEMYNKYLTQYGEQL